MSEYKRLTKDNTSEFYVKEAQLSPYVIVEFNTHEEEVNPEEVCKQLNRLIYLENAIKTGTLVFIDNLYKNCKDPVLMFKKYEICLRMINTLLHMDSKQLDKELTEQAIKEIKGEEV